MEGDSEKMIEYKTECRLCHNIIVIEIDDQDDFEAKQVGLNLEKWMGRVLCESCYTYKETGHRPTNAPPMRDFLFG